MRGPRAFSILGMLISMVCIAVLAAIMLSALNKSMTGAGNTLPNSVASLADETSLYSLYTSMAAGAGDNNDRFLVPSAVAAGRDASLDTTASLFSLMVARNYISTEKLISRNERNPNVLQMDNYNFAAINPGTGVYWDVNFAADLQRQSNVSYAHMPLFGQRVRQHWQPHSGNTFYPLIGNRGPRGGVVDPASYTIGRDGTWAGFMVFSDGHVEYVKSFTMSGPGLDGGRPDNIFAMETGEAGSDAIITFTKEMTEDGPLIQHD
jgi:hypothetical protein